MATNSLKKNKKNWEDMSRKEKVGGIIGLIIIGFIVIGIIGAIFGDHDNSKASTVSTQKSQPSKTEPKPQDKTTEAQTKSKKSANSSKPAPKSSLAAQVQAAYLKQIGYGSIAELNLDKDDVVGSPEKEITSFEDESNGVIKVNVQDSLTKAQAKQIGTDVMIGASDIRSLKWVDVRGTNGTYAEVSRQDAGLAD